jgi:hypothetical protein
MEKKAPSSKTRHIGLRMPHEVYDDVAALASAQERSVSWMIVKIVREYLAGAKGGGGKTAKQK